MVNSIKIGLVHKGLILISLPLLVQLVLVGGLYQVNQEAETAASKAKAAGVEVERVQELVLEALNLSTVLNGGAIGAKDFDVLRYKRNLDALTRKANSMLAETQLSGHPRQALEDLVGNLNTIKSLLDELLRVYLTDRQNLASTQMRVRDRFKALYNDGGHSALIGILNENKAILDAVPIEEARRRSKIRNLILALVLVNVTLTLVLAVLYTRNIAARIMSLAANSDRIAHGKSLPEALKGNDEIAEVDLALHDMATRLSTLERARRSLLSMFTHDLRTPLSSIMVILADVAEGEYGRLNDEGLSTLGTAQKSAQRMRQMMTDLLELDKIRSGQMPLHKVQLSAHDLFSETAELMVPMAQEKEIELVISPVKSDLEIYADYNRSNQILLNLLSNAIKFSPRKTRIRLEAIEEEAMVRIQVIDQGKGVDPATMHLIFDAYKQGAKEDAKYGHGLGLAICKSLVSLHGGSLSCQNNEAKGATFAFTLPKSATN